MDWTAEQVVAGYSGQQQIERVFRGLKEGDWLGWGPMYHWTDQEIRVHAYYCMLGFALLYPPQSEKGLNRVALVLSKQTLAQQSLAKELGLDTLRAAKESNTRAT